MEFKLAEWNFYTLFLAKMCFVKKGNSNLGS